MGPVLSVFFKRYMLYIKSSIMNGVMVLGLSKCCRNSKIKSSCSKINIRDIFISMRIKMKIKFGVERYCKVSYEKRNRKKIRNNKIFEHKN